MAVLETLRKKMGVFITILIALALLLFVVDADKIQSLTSLFSSKYDIGKIGGKKVSAQEFQSRVDQYKKVYELTTGTSSFDEQTSDMITNSAWQDEITERILMPAFKNAGISVGEGELADMISGTDISPILANEAAFMGDDGQFDREKVLNLINEVPNDPNLQTYWSFIQDNMIKDRMFTKYASLLEKSAVVNSLELKNDIADNNSAYDIDFVVKPAGYESDSTITVTNNEVRDYYNKIKSSKSLIQDESRDADLVVFNILPTEEDRIRTKEEVDNLYAEFLNLDGTDLKNFLYKNSDKPFDNEYYKKGDLNDISTILDEFASGSAVGAVLEPQSANNIYFAAKIIDKTSRPDSVFVKYLPVGMDENRADSLVAVLRQGKNFAEVAATVFPAEFAQQLAPGQELGDLGWITEAAIPTYLPKEFKPVFAAKQGDVLKIQTGGNYYVVVAAKQSKYIPKSQVAILTKEVAPSQETFANVYSEALDLVEKSNGKREKMLDFAHERGLNVVPASRVVGSQKVIANYQNMREITRWIFENKEDNVSPVMTVDDKYYMVAAVKKIHKGGVAPYEDVAPQIRTLIELEKRIDKLADNAKKEVKGSTIEDVAEALNTTVSSQDGVTFASLQSMQQLDPKFLGAVATAGSKGNTNLVGPVKGNIGIYYFQIKNRENKAFYTEDDAANKRKNIIGNVINALPQIMMQKAGIVDQRYKFF